MENFLKRIGLIEYDIIELPMKKEDFVQRLKRLVDKDSIEMWADFNEIFTSTKNKYKGSIQPTNFKIKRKRSLFDFYGFNSCLI